ncbi:MAG: HAD-IA family hydrolase [Alphaproteobacteria bacterium]|jgi:HAD superfamily hydrolase (TIGR01509 family)|nr:HAD-IA family hydrolase [Alphaproteobacteria bacterium]
MTPRLVVFDCDGVVVDSEIITNTFLRDEMAAHGLDLPLDQIMGLFVGGTIAGVAVKARELGARLPQGWVESFYTRLCARLAQGTPMIAGIVGVLERLESAGIPYCIGSNGRHVKMQATLGQHPELAARFTSNVFAASDIARPKPAPDLFLHAAATMGHPPDACVVIEDSPTGARAAKAAGMRCFGYAPEGDGAKLAAEGAQVFRSMDGLPALLGL